MKIVRTEVTEFDVVITLEDGKKVHVCSNKDYLHLHFTGIGDKKIKADQVAANQCNINWCALGV